MAWIHYIINKRDKHGKGMCQSHAYQAAAMCGKTCRQKLFDMGRYLGLDR